MKEFIRKYEKEISSNPDIGDNKLNYLSANAEERVHIRAYVSYTLRTPLYTFRTWVDENGRAKRYKYCYMDTYDDAWSESIKNFLITTNPEVLIPKDTE